MKSNLAADSPRVTAVVLNWCDEEATADCLSSLQESSYPALSILLVDNGSPDGSGALLHERFPGVPFLQTGDNLGFTGGNNRGIERALQDGAEFILVLNNDTRVEPGAIATLVETAQGNDSIGAVAPTVVRMGAPDSVWYGGGAFDTKRGFGMHWNGKGPPAKGPRPVTFFSGCAVLLRREAIADVGGFEESYFMYVEDAELSLRLLRGGWKIIHDPGARIHHRVPARGSEPTPDQIFYRDRNRRRLVREHLGSIGRLRFGIWFYPTRAVHLVRYAATGDFPRVRALLRGLGTR